MAKLPLIIIGAGSIGQRHMQVAAEHPNVDLVGVVEPAQPLQLKLAAEGWPMFTTIDKAPKAAAAIISTPTADHAAAAFTCLDRGLAVLVEKPIAHTIAAGKASICKASALNLPLFVGHHRRCHPFSINMRDRLVGLGTMIGVQGMWSLRKHNTYYDAFWRTQPGAGPLMTNLSHEVDLLQFFMGRIANVASILSNKARSLDVEDTASLSFEFESGALGSFLISDAGLSPWAFEAATSENPAVAGSGEDYLRLVGTNGAMSFPSGAHWTAETGPKDWTTPLALHTHFANELVDPLVEQLSRFANVVAGAEDEILCTGEEGLGALEVTLATVLAAKTGQAVSTKDVPPAFNGTSEVRGRDN